MVLRSASGMEGAETRGTDLYEELTCDGEKPRTTLVVLRSDIPLAVESEEACIDSSEAESEVESLLSIAGMAICGVAMLVVWGGVDVLSTNGAK